MTRKDYRRIARVIADTLASYKADNASPRATIYVLASTMAEELALDNPRFDRARFMRACGLIVE